MKFKNGGIGITILAGVILAVIIVFAMANLTTGKILPALGDKIDQGNNWLLGSAKSCENLPEINLSHCAEGVNCKTSENYTDISTYAVTIPTPTEYWMNVTLKKDKCRADDNTEADLADTYSNNDPDLYTQHEYKPLIYEFKIGDHTVYYNVTNPNDDFENITLYIGPLDTGAYNLRWRIVTDWDNSSKPNDEYYHRTGEISKIRIFCEVV